MKLLTRLPAARVGVIGNVLAFAGGVAFLQMQSGLPSLGVLAALTGLSSMGLWPRLRRLFFVAPLCFALARVLSAVPLHGLEAVLVAVELVLEFGVLRAEHIENVLMRIRHPVHFRRAFGVSPMAWRRTFRG